MSYFGTMLVHNGLVDGMVSGAAHTTAHRPPGLRDHQDPARGIHGLQHLPDVPERSGPGLRRLRDRPDPTATELADIAISSARTAAQFGIDPRGRPCCPTRPGSPAAAPASTR